MVWKRLKHLNIVPLLGITPVPLQLISEWMPGGDLAGYIKKHSSVDRLGLVGVSPAAFGPSLTPATSCVASLVASTFSTPAT